MMKEIIILMKELCVSMMIVMEYHEIIDEWNIRRISISFIYYGYRFI